MTTIPAIAQTISAVPTPGHRGVDTNTDFVTKQEAYQDHQRTTLQPEYSQAIVEQNAMKTAMNTFGAEVQALGVTVEANASIALAASNNVGLYSLQTGSLAVPASTTYLNRFWILNYNIADVTAEVPGVSAAWTEIILGYSFVGIKTGAYTAKINEYVKTLSSFTLTIPAGINDGDEIVFEKIDTTTDVILTVNMSATDTLTYKETSNASWIFTTNTRYRIIYDLANSTWRL